MKNSYKQIYETVSLSKASQIFQKHTLNKTKTISLSGKSNILKLEVNPNWNTFNQVPLDFTTALLSNVKAEINVDVNHDIRLVFIEINDNTLQAIE